MAVERGGLLAGGQVPQLDLGGLFVVVVIAGAGRDRLAVGREGHAADRLLVPFEDHLDSAGGRVPDLHLEVGVGGGEGLAVGRPGEVGHVAGAALDDRPHQAAARVPQADSLVVAAGGHRLAVAAVGDEPHLPLVPADRHARLDGRRGAGPDAGALVEAAGEDLLAVGREGDGGDAHLVGEEAAALPAGVGLPQAQGAVHAAGDEVAAARRERQGQYVGALAASPVRPRHLELPHFLALGHVPQDHGGGLRLAFLDLLPFLGGGGEKLAVRREGQGADAAGLALELVDFLLLGHVPQADRVVAGAGGQRLAVRLKATARMPAVWPVRLPISFFSATSQRRTVLS